MLFLRGLWWRRGYSLAVLMVGLVSAAVATIGPLYARAASESTLTDALGQAGYRTGMAFTAQSYVGEAGDLDALRKQVGSATAVRGYGTPIEGRSILATARAPGAGYSTIAPMAYRSDVCAHVVVLHGRCPTAAGEGMVDENTLDDGPHWRLGQTLTMHQAGAAQYGGFSDAAPLSAVRIVGVYRPRDIDEAYWFDLPLFSSRLGPGISGAGIQIVDAVFVSDETFARPADSPANDDLELDVPLLPSSIRLDDVGRLAADVRAVQRRFPTKSTNGSPTMLTGLFGTLAQADQDRHEVDQATLVVVLELAVLSLLVLFQVVGGAVAARGDEIALAKLRGLPPARTVLFALREPLTLLLVAAPIGLAVGYLATAVLADTELAGGTPVSLRGPTWLALAGALAGAVIAAGLGAIKTITRPVLEQWRNTSPPSRGRVLLAGFELLLAAAAVVTVIAMRTSSSAGDGRTVFLVAPALLVLAVALIGVRLLPLVGRLGLGPTRATGRLASFLALRQTVRRPGGLRLAALLALAAGLATFAVCGEAVANANRVARARTETGTATQLSVQFGLAHDPETAVSQVDPQGRWAMAVATWVPDGDLQPGATITGPLMGVDPARLRAIGYQVRGQRSPAQLAADLGGDVPAPATFRGTSLSVTMDTTALSGSHPTVLLVFRHQHAQSQSVPSTPLLPGRHTYTVRADCTGGCSFAGITLDNSIDASAAPSGTVAITAVDTTTAAGATAPVPVELDSARAWRQTQLGYGAHTTFAVQHGALVASYRTDSVSSPTFTYADSPVVLPVVAAPAALSAPGRTGQIADYSETTYDYRLVRTASPLPVVLDTGAITDLDYLRIRFPRFDGEATWSVWLGPAAPADAVSRLERAGLIVQSSTTEAHRVTLLARQGPALGLLLLLVCAIAAAALAVLGTAAALLADARRRSFELAALRVIGVRHRVLRRAAVAEQALLLGAALLLGIPAGYLAAYLALPVIPEFSDHTPTVLRYTPSVLVALACAAAFGILLWITAVVAGRILVRSAVPARLREVAR